MVFNDLEYKLTAVSQSKRILKMYWHSVKLWARVQQGLLTQWSMDIFCTILYTDSNVTLYRVSHYMS